VFARSATLASLVFVAAASVPSNVRGAGPDGDASASGPQLAPPKTISPEAGDRPLTDESPAAAELAVRVAHGAPLRLAWVDPIEAAGRSAVGAREEAARVLSELGITTTWRRAAAGEQAREGELRVIVLGHGAMSASHASVLGSTPTRFVCSPFVWIHVPGVRAAAGLRPAAVAELRDRYLLGIALGRVIVHEVLHALVPSVPHGEGIMKSRLSRLDLTTDPARVTPELVALVRAALAAGPDPARPVTGLLAAEHARGEQLR
jgi:hypothetical protein